MEMCFVCKREKWWIASFGLLQMSRIGRNVIKWKCWNMYWMRHHLRHAQQTALTQNQWRTDNFSMQVQPCCRSHKTRLQQWINDIWLHWMSKKLLHLLRTILLQNLSNKRLSKMSIKPINQQETTIMCKKMRLKASTETQRKFLNIEFLQCL